MPRRWFIYVLCDPRTEEVRYVGKAVNPAARYAAHCAATPKHGGHCPNWIRRLKSLGLLPRMDVIDAGMGNGWGPAERAWIAEYRRRGAHLTNITDGGDGGSGPKSEATRAKIVAANTGKRHTPETRAKMSAARMGRVPTPRMLEAFRIANANRVLSPETRARIGRTKRGVKQSPEHIAKRAAAMRGHPVSAATREKIAATKRGKPRSPETREKLRRALLRYQAERRESQ